MSNRKLYLNLKQSFLELFRTRAYYLKEMTSKWSIFDKPYLDEDYRAMHLKFPKPRWGSGRGDTPQQPTRRWTFQWSQGSCWMGAANPVCGEEFGISAMIADVPPYELGAAAVFTATSSDPTKVWLIRQEQGMDSFATEFIFRAAEDWEGTVTICVKASLKGKLLKEYVVPIPADYRGDLRLEEAFRIKPISEAMYSGIFSLSGPNQQKVSQGTATPFSGASNLLNFQMASQGGESVSGPFKTTFEGRGWDCGCNDIVVSCDTCDDSGLSWDDPTSADTVARSNSATVAILDSTTKGGPYSWSVAGTGFTLTNATTVGLSNTLNADASACGTATVTVTGCNGATVTGYVRCTTGTWVVDAGIVTCPWSFVGTGSPYTWGKWRITQSLWVCLSGGGSCVTPAYCATHPVSSCKPGGSMNCDNAPCSNGCNGADCAVFGTMHCTPCAQPLPQKNGVMGLQDCGCEQRSCAAGQENCERYIAVLRNWKAEVWSCA